jgi:hypothetical protein
LKRNSVKSNQVRVKGENHGLDGAMVFILSPLLSKPFAFEFKMQNTGNVKCKRAVDLLLCQENVIAVG